MLSPTLKLMPLFFSIIGCLTSFLVYKFSIFTLSILAKKSFLHKFYSFFNRKWYFDNVYNDLIMNKIVKSGYFFFVKSVDKGLLEFLGPLGLLNFFREASKKASNFQSGLIYHYAFVFLTGLLFILTVFAFNFS